MVLYSPLGPWDQINSPVSVLEWPSIQNYKTTLLIINGKKKEQLEILIDGVVIQQEQSAKCRYPSIGLRLKGDRS